MVSFKKKVLFQENAFENVICKLSNVFVQAPVFYLCHLPGTHFY